jgi:hypothetical protein
MAKNAKHDENSVPTVIAASKNDGRTIVPIFANPSNNALNVSDGNTGTDYGRSVAIIDENGVSVIMAVSSTDGVTPVEIYADPVNGKLLIQST